MKFFPYILHLKHCHDRDDIHESMSECVAAKLKFISFGFFTPVKILNEKIICERFFCFGVCVCAGAKWNPFEFLMLITLRVFYFDA